MNSSYITKKVHLKIGHACRLTPGSLALCGALLLGSSVWGPLHALGAGGLVWLTYTGFQLAKQPEENVGHRAGAPGFLGESSFALSKSSWTEYVVTGLHAGNA